MDSTKESPVILSICTGIRGLERGIERAIGPVRVAAYVEIEAFIVWNLVAQMEAGLLDPTPIWTDVKTFPARYFHSKIHIITGGYPCQPFSNAGERKGEEDPRHLYPYIENIIQAIGPICCFFENVSGHLTLGFESVKKSMESMGYRVEAGIYSAEEVGAPHRRERLFILAILENANLPASWYNSGKNEGKSGIENVRSGDGETCAIQTGTTSKNELANANSTTSGRTDREIQGEASTVKGAPQGENGKRVRDEFGNSSESMANSICHNGTEIQTEIGGAVGRQESISHGSSWGTDRFPTRPGEQQYEWEEPRTSQSGMGSTAHGYDFREDLLRALGNGVVEQTAELAFRDLLRKHLTNGTEQDI